MTYAKSVKSYEDTKGLPVSVRTDYRCKAHGCPNAGCMERDLCYAHWSCADPAGWSAVTQANREDFDSRRNWGEVSLELQARRLAESKRKHQADIGQMHAARKLP